MQAAPRNSNSKWHSPMPSHSADTSQSQVNQSAKSQSIQTGIPGEDRNLPGQRSAEYLTNSYGEERHMAMDSELAQPAYSGHGKVRVGSTSAL